MWKNRLRAFRESVQELGHIKHRLEDMEARIYTPRAQRFTSTPHAASGGHTMDDVAIAHIQLQETYREKLEAIEREQIAIEDAMRVLKPKQRIVLRCYYFDVMTWEQVCRAALYGWTQTHRLHSEALRLLDEADKTE